MNVGQEKPKEPITEDAARTASNQAKVMLENPPLSNLAIANFRPFRHLQIDRLGHVNLIVGKNNVGKTSLLEALWLYASGGAAEVIQQLLTARNEFTLRKADESQLATVKHLFYGRQFRGIEKQQLITIGPATGSGNKSKILSLQAIVLDQEIVLEIEALATHPEGAIKVRDLVNQLHAGQFSALRTWNNLSIQSSGETDLLFTVKQDKAVKIINESFKQIILSDMLEIPSRFISSHGLTEAQVAQLWDDVYLTNLQDDVEAALRIIEPEIKNVGLVTSLEENRRQVPQARVSGSNERVLLSSLGEGMNRIFGLALALVNAKNGYLLIDEVGNGIHYSVQPKLWDFIFTQAQQLNVQVFATTHSWDAVEAFQQAAQTHTEVEGMLVSLRPKEGSPGKVIGTLFNEADLAYITREQIEVR